ncbi:IS3 family transposase [Pantoea eucalypti]
MTDSYPQDASALIVNRVHAAYALWPSECQWLAVLHQNEITETRIHHGYRRVYVMLRREGCRNNHKRIYRLFSEQALLLRLKRPRRNKSAQRRQPQPQPQPQGLYSNHVWGMEFVSDVLFDRRRLRLLKVIDLYTDECLGSASGRICVQQKWQKC